MPAAKLLSSLPALAAFLVGQPVMAGPEPTSSQAEIRAAEDATE